MGNVLLFMAARRQLFVEKIIPAVMSGKVFVGDRFTMSTITYQGLSDPEWIKQIEHLEDWVLGTTNLDTGGAAAAEKLRIVYLLLQAPYEVWGKRLEGKDAFERRGEDFLKSVWRAYDREGGTRYHTVDGKDNLIRIDATGTKEEVAERVWAAVKKLAE